MVFLIALLKAVSHFYWGQRFSFLVIFRVERSSPKTGGVLPPFTSTSPTQNRPKHPAQNLLSDGPADGAGHAAGGALGGAFEHAFAVAATWAGGAAEQVTDGAEDAAGGLRRGFGLAGLRGGLVARLRLLVGAVAPVAVVEVAVAAAGRRRGDGTRGGLGGGRFAAQEFVGGFAVDGCAVGGEHRRGLDHGLAFFAG